MRDRRPSDWNPWQKPSRESLVDRKIREAIDEGLFDDLPFRGERLPVEDDSAAGDWAMAYRMLKEARFAPPWIESDKEVRALLAERDELLAGARGTRSTAPGRERSQQALARIVEAANAAIFRLNHEAPTERQHRRLLDIAVELEALDSAFAED